MGSFHFDFDPNLSLLGNLAMSSKSHEHSHINEAAERAKKVAADLAEKAHDSIDGVKQAMTETASHVRDAASDLYDRGRVKASDTMDRAADRVREHTGTSLLIAALLGLLVGLLIGRRR